MHREVHTVEERDYAVNGRLPMLAAIVLVSLIHFFTSLVFFQTHEETRRKRLRGMATRALGRAA